MRHGLTLIECAVVVALCAFLAVLSMRLMVCLEPALVRAELERIAALCAEYENRSRKEQKTFTIQCLVNDRAIVVDGKKFPLTQGVMFGTMPAVKGPPAEPTKPVKNPVTFAGNTIVFNPTGTTQAGTMYVCDERRTCTYALSLNVARVSYARRWAWKEGKWQLLF